MKNNKTLFSKLSNWLAKYRITLVPLLYSLLQRKNLFFTNHLLLFVVLSLYFSNDSNGQETEAFTKQDTSYIVYKNDLQISLELVKETEEKKLTVNYLCIFSFIRVFQGV